MVDKVSVALALIGSNHAPVSNLEPLRPNILIERDLSDGALLVICSQPTKPGRYVEQSASASSSRLPSRNNSGLHHHHPRNKSPLTDLDANKASEEEEEARRAQFAPIPPSEGSTTISHFDQPVAAVAAEKLAQHHPPPARHSHRRSLSTSEHLHFAGKTGPPTLSAAAFEPDEHLLSSNSSSNSPQSVSQSEEDAAAVQSVRSAGSNDSNSSVVKTTVPMLDEDALSLGEASAALDTPKSVVRVANGEEEEDDDEEEEELSLVQQRQQVKSLNRTPSLNAAAMILLKRKNSFSSSAISSPRPRLGSAPDMLVFDLDTGTASAGAEQVSPTGENLGLFRSTSKESLASDTTTSSSNPQQQQRSRRSSHRRHHSRQLSQPTLAGGGVEIDAAATNTANEAEENAQDKTDLILPDGLIVTSQGITNSPSPSNHQYFGGSTSTGSSTSSSSAAAAFKRNLGNFKLDTATLQHASHSPSKLSQPTPRLLAPGHFNPDDLETLGLIGKGSAGIVTKALHVSALRLVAVKSVQKFDFTKRETTIAEIRALHRKMIPFLESDWKENPEDSSCIVGFYDAYIPKSGASVNLVLEWMDGGSLQDLVDRKTAAGERLSEEFISVACRRMLRGLVELQESRLLHRDMKPANVLVSKSGAIKLSDFGVSIAFGLGDLSNAQTYIGSLSYMAPERVHASKQGEDGGYSYASDLWAVGLIAYVCATGDYPFKKQFDDEGFWGLYQAVEEDVPRLSEDLYSAELIDFVAKCLRKDPAQRPTAQDLLETDAFVAARSNAKEAVAREFEAVDQAAAREELSRLLDIVCESHRRRYLESVRNDAIPELYEAPIFTKNRLRVLCGQLRIEFAPESNEETQILNALNTKLQEMCGGGSGGDSDHEEEEAEAPTSQEEEENREGYSPASWKKKNLTLELH